MFIQGYMIVTQERDEIGSLILGFFIRFGGNPRSPETHTQDDAIQLFHCDSFFVCKTRRKNSMPSSILISFAIKISSLFRSRERE